MKNLYFVGFLILLQTLHIHCESSPSQAWLPSQIQNNPDFKTVWENSQKPQTLTFLHIADASNLLPGPNQDAARIAHIIKTFRDKGTEVYVTFGGDGFRPNLLHSLFGDTAYTALFNAIGFDYAVVGNHELDLGVEAANLRIQNTKTIWFAQNLTLASSPLNLLYATPAKPVDLTPQVQIFGVITDALGKQTKGLRKVSDWMVHEPVQSVANLVKKPDQLNVILTHLTDKQEDQIADLPGLSLVLGGMTFANRKYQSGDGSVVLETKPNFASIAIATITLAKQPEKSVIHTAFVDINEAIPRDPKIAKTLDVFLQDPKMLPYQETIGSLAVNLNCKKSDISSLETNCGNLVANALFASVPQADFALISGGSIEIDAVLKSGNINRAEAEWIVPFEDEIVGITLAGEDLYTFLENTLWQANVPAGLYSVAGLSYRYDATKPFGQRLVREQVLFQGKPIDPQKMYNMATIQYIADSAKKWGVNFTVYFKGSEHSLPTLRYVIRDHIKKNSPIQVGLENRFGPIQ